MGTELEQLMHGMEKIITNLFKLSTMIRKGNVSHDRLVKSSKIDVSHYEHYDLQHARTRFPAGSQYLIDRMGKAISRRRQYLKYREEHHEKLAGLSAKVEPHDQYSLVRQHHPGLETPSLSPNMPANNSTEHDRGYEYPMSIVQSTNASTFVASKIPAPVNLDVEVASMADTESSYVTSAVGEEKLRVPPPPESSRGGLSFECPYCYTICRLNGPEEWQRRREWK